MGECPRVASDRVHARCLVLAFLLLILLAGLRPGSVRADGDPASDILVNQALFLPAEAAAPVRDQLRLVSLLNAARRAGLPIRVAIISSPSDLGAVSELWDEPRTYARFLGIELSLTARAPLVVVMPNGVGFYSPGRSATAIDDRVGRIATGASGSALVGAAQAAVIAVAQAGHVRGVPPDREAGAGLRAPTSWRPTSDRVFGLTVLACLAAAACVGRLAFIHWRSAG